MSRFGRNRSEFPKQVETDLGQLLIYILKEVLTIENKYGYKVPFLISEHRSIKQNEEFTTLSILRVNEHFLNDILPRLEKT
jgi:hypothetical protein